MTVLRSKYGQDRPISTLLALFITWKSLVGVIALVAPGVGYDTSTALLSAPHHRLQQHGGSSVPARMPSSWLKFVRWDAIYFTHMADQGHVFEQEWAFGVGLSTVISWLAKGLLVLGVCESLASVVAGILLSHVSHWLSVVQLWALTRALVASSTNTTHFRSLAFDTAALHIISPAGIFLSAPDSESLFSLLSISGLLGFVYAMQYFDRAKVSAGCTAMFLAGAQLGAATIVRSNGILAGIPFLIEAFSTSLHITSQGLSTARLVRFSALIAGGLLIACGMLLPQSLGYLEYCYGRSPGDRRPWCENTLPSIFTFVQSHYWHVGLFRYWTLSNVPLFLLAAPALWLLIYSAIDVLQHPQTLLSAASKSAEKQKPPSTLQTRLLISLALPQLVLAVLALTSYHVQIITRLSSGYPVWYIWLASKLQSEPKRTSLIIRWMVMYGLIQAGLYACFLPPA